MVMNDTIRGKKVRQTTWPACRKVQILICKMELHLEIRGLQDPKVTWKDSNVLTN